MTLQQLKYAVEVANKSSISRAAKGLYISQPSLSNAIRDLENELNIHIFIRTNKGISLSNEGRIFLQSARHIVQEAESIENRYKGNQTQKYFSISAQHYAFVLRAFAVLMKQVADTDAEYDLHIREAEMMQVIDDVAASRSEIGIIYTGIYGEADTKRLINGKNLMLCELFTSEIYVLLNKKHPLSKKEKICVLELKNYPYVSFEQGELSSNYFYEDISCIHEHKKNIKVSDRSEMFFLMKQINAFTIGKRMLDPELHGRDLVAIPLDVKEVIKVSAIWQKNICLSPLAELFMEQVSLEIEKMKQKDEKLVIEKRYGKKRTAFEG